MIYQPTIQLPLSSDEISLGLLEEFIIENEKNGSIEELEYQFNILSQSNKYLGEDLFLLSDNNENVDTLQLTNEITEGQQIIDIFGENNSNSGISIPLSSSILSDVATAGSNLLDSDIIWQFDGNNLEGAWLKSFDNETVETTACIKLNTGQTELRFPYINKGLIYPDGSWSGFGIDNCYVSPYVDTQNLSSGEPLYWEYNNELSSTNSISLQESKLIESGANASKNIFKADQILVKPNRDSTLEEFAWLYDFKNTELPIGCGETKIYWPVSVTQDSDNLAIPVQIGQVEDLKLKDLWINKTMCGAVAGLTPDSSDKIFLQSSECGSTAEGAWLRGSDISEIGEEVTLSATTEDLFRYSDVFLSSGNIVLSAEVPPSVSDSSINCCGSSYDPEKKYTGDVVADFVDISVVSGSVFNIKDNRLEWGIATSGSSQKNIVSFIPKEFEVSVDEVMEIGELYFENIPTTTGTQINGFSLQLGVNLDFVKTTLEFPVDVISTIGNNGGDSDYITFDGLLSEQTFEICGKVFVLKLNLELLETTGGFLDIERSRIYAEEGKRTTVKVLASLVKEEDIAQSIFSFNLKEFNLNETDYDYSWTLDKNSGNFTVFADSKTDGVIDDEFNFTINSDGINYIKINDGITENITYARIFLDSVSEKIKDINGAPRQSGIHFIAPKEGAGYFFWEFPDININEVLRGCDHDEYCDYLKIDKYTSILNPRKGDETSQWSQCNCKAQYYSPFGHNLNFEDYKDYTDIIMEDDGEDLFSFENWEDSEGRDYKSSDQFGIFKYSGPEPDVGFGIGTWETYNGGDFLLKKGKSYRYIRATLGGCDDSELPCLVVNNCHCLDKCDDDVDNIKWIKLLQNSDGEWEDTGEVSDMVLRAGQFYQYERTEKINYNIVKDGRIVSRETTTPSFSLNINFKQAIPYWAKSARLGGLNYGLEPKETDKYLLTSQPEPSDIILSDDVYIKYIRNDCSALQWEQPLTFSVDFKTKPTWKKIDFGFVSPPLLQKIIGCSTCGIEYDESRDSCFLMANNCQTHIASFVGTDIDSDMVIRSSLDCNNNTQVFFGAKNSFTWTEDFNVGENFFGASKSFDTYLEAPKPWRNLLNENTATVHFDERGLVQKTAREVGLFKPRLVGVNKVECFDIKKEV